MIDLGEPFAQLPFSRPLGNGIAAVIDAVNDKVLIYDESYLVSPVIFGGIGTEGKAIRVIYLPH